MQVEPEIVGRNFDLRESMRTEILERIEGLEKFFDKIISCKVKVEAIRKSESAPHAFSVAINLAVPNATIVVNRPPRADLGNAVREAFDAAKRDLEDYVRKLRGDVKNHVEQPVGRVSKLVAHEDYGFIKSSQGDEIYFHRNSVVDGDFDGLKIGDRVRYVVETGHKGLQASTVHAGS